MVASHYFVLLIYREIIGLDMLKSILSDPSGRCWRVTTNMTKSEYFTDKDLMPMVNLK